MLFFPVSGEGAYWVLDTDYTSFAVVYSCTPITPLLKSREYSIIVIVYIYSNWLLFSIIEIVWILTRDQNPDASVINAGLAVMDLNSLSRFPLRVTDQTNCWRKSAKPLIYSLNKRNYIISCLTLVNQVNMEPINVLSQPLHRFRSFRFFSKFG